jgi:2-polyprenyl-6-methoxyphenol hydroxylase-like FAD-dependent oxidoreductase
MTTDILIVGAGPVGLTGALLAHELGLSVRIIDRRPSTKRAPAAHVINARTFEIWRQIGLDVNAIRSHAQTPEKAGHVHWVTRLGETVIGTLPYEQQGDDNFDITPTPLRNLSQHRLEPLLTAELQQRGIAVEYSSSYVSHAQTASGFTSTVQVGDALSNIESTWLIACDGASSSVRQNIGIAMDGPDNLQQFNMFHFQVDLAALVGSHPGILYWICDPYSGGALVSHGGDNEWVYMMPADGARTEPFTDEECFTHIRRPLAPTDSEITLLRQSSWTMTSQLAQSYRKGRVFLAGDAAHRFPPTGGMGLNTGVGDIHNLLWKISKVERGSADDELLNSYESERRVIAERNAQASLENAFKMFDVFMALGIDPDKEVSAKNLEAALNSAESLASIETAINNQATHFNMIGLQIGYRYMSEHSTTPLEVLTDEFITTYRPSVEPGNRLPHGWLERNGETISSLDLVPLHSHVVIGGAQYSGERCDVRLGTDVTDTDNWWSSTLQLLPHQALVVRPDQHIEQIRG